MGTSKEIPKTPADWYVLATENWPSDLQTGLQASEWNSASKMTWNQFLLLRAYWQPTKGVNQFHLDKILDATLAQESKNMVESQTYVAEYLAELEARTYARPEQPIKCAKLSSGPFALVLYQQDQVSDKEPVVEDGNTKVIISPRYSLRSRTAIARKKAVEGTPTPAGWSNTHDTLTDSLAKMNLEGQSTPESTRLSHLQVETTPEQKDTQEDASTDWSTVPGSTETHLSAFSQFSPEQVQSASDEQIVNVALVSFLQAATMYWCSGVGWTLHRNIFKMNNLYEARTDGCLCPFGQEKIPLAILETKAYVRTANETQIRIQETAQMAAWIRQKGPGTLFSEANNLFNTQRRLLISQDNREIYITIGEYDDQYEAYLERTSETPTDQFDTSNRYQFDHSDKGPFLKLTCYGPFDIHHAGHMKRFAAAVIAFTKALQR